MLRTGSSKNTENPNVEGMINSGVDGVRRTRSSRKEGHMDDSLQLATPLGEKRKEELNWEEQTLFEKGYMELKSMSLVERVTCEGENEPASMSGARKGAAEVGGEHSEKMTLSGIGDEENSRKIAWIYVTAEECRLLKVSRGKQKKESDELMLENRWLTTTNDLLRQENDELQQKVNQLISENEHLRNQILDLTTHITTFDLDQLLEAYHAEMGSTPAENSNGLSSLAVEIRKEFLAKAIGTSIIWTPTSGLKLDSAGVYGTVYIPSTCVGVAARARASINFDHFQASSIIIFLAACYFSYMHRTLEMLKDRPSWSRFCRGMDVIAKHHTNEGTIELIYTKYYAPTTMALARDFWTLRYTSILDDGSLVVCEKSISGSDAGVNSPSALEFVRGRMLASGFMICPGQGGSTIHIVEHYDMEASSVPLVVRPLYESSEFLGKKTIVPALLYIEHMASEMSGIPRPYCHENPVLLRWLCLKLSRGFNDAVNCFSEDGWTLMGASSSDDVIMSTKRATNLGVYANCDSILCLKASLLLQNVYPVSLVKLLTECRSAWMGFNFNEHMVASRPALYAFPGHDIYRVSEFSSLLGQINNEDEALEIIRLDCADRQRNYYSVDFNHLQMNNGMADNGFGACSELIFAPIDLTTPNDAPYLSCGFRIILLGSDTESSSSPLSMLILAFQFPYETQHLDEIAVVAKLYVKYVISCVKIISGEVAYSGFCPNVNPAEASSTIVSRETIYANLANVIRQSYRSSLGVDMVGLNPGTPNLLFDQIHRHRYAILCFSAMSRTVCEYANRTALNVLQMTPGNLQILTVDSLFCGSDFSLTTVFQNIMLQGYVFLPPGRFMSTMTRTVFYEQALVLQLQPPDGSFNGFALVFMELSFI
ncbi:homeobox leucine-zipper protein [Striga asiatica]|uniref:Homeobox leucine-zipper protein n=1 Tax=Striga asiatica TaxID=4170 RepID=A0A5A7QDV1_STRAF|nr:homeobox leucine-zipper protein [Striga asiatica]